LFWRKLSSVLIIQKFVLNLYDSCVANKMINGNQCTILWHIDDLKIAHIDPAVVTSVIVELTGVFGTQALLSVTKRKIHHYLGMTLDFTKHGIVEISIAKYIKDMLNGIPDDINGESPTLAANYLFQVNEIDLSSLDESTAMLFHHNVAKLLFLCKQAKLDIKTALAFLYI
jgi:hypothetical protein